MASLYFVVPSPRSGKSGVLIKVAHHSGGPGSNSTYLREDNFIWNPGSSSDSDVITLCHAILSGYNREFFCRGEAGRYKLELKTSAGLRNFFGPRSILELSEFRTYGDLSVGHGFVVLPSDEVGRVGSRPIGETRGNNDSIGVFLGIKPGTDLTDGSYVGQEKLFVNSVKLIELNDGMRGTRVRAATPKEIKEKEERFTPLTDEESKKVETSFLSLFETELPVCKAVPCAADPRLSLSPFVGRDYTRIGYTAFQIPPQGIAIDIEHGLDAVETMRSNTAAKQIDTKVLTNITLNFTVPDTNQYSVTVQGLLEQFKRCPFLPIVNDMLNDGHNIDAIALKGMSVSTVPGTPGMFDVTIQAQPFDWRNYIPTGESYENMFCWPLFQIWCKDRFYGITKPSETSPGATELSSNLTGDFVLEFADADETDVQVKLGGVTLDKNPLIAIADKYVVEQIPSTLAKVNPKKTPKLGGAYVPNLRAFIGEDSQTYVAIKVNSYSALITLFERASRDPQSVKVWTGVRANTKTLDKVTGTFTDLKKTTELPKGSIDTILSKLQGDMRSSPELLGHGANGLGKQYEFIIPEGSPVFNTLLGALSIGFTSTPTSPAVWNTFDLHEAVIIENITTQFANNIAVLHPRTSAGEIHQFMGGTDATISINGYVYGLANISHVTDTIKTLQGLAKRFRARAWGMDSLGFFKVKNEILNSQGIFALVPISVSHAAVDGYPDLYTVKLNCIQYRETQRDAQRGENINNKFVEWVKGDGRRLFEALAALDENAGTLDLDKLSRIDTLSDILRPLNVDGPATKWAAATIQKMIAQMVEVYPDLELPTREEYNSWLLEIKKFIEDENYDGVFGDILPLIVAQGDNPAFDIYNKMLTEQEFYKTTFGFCDPDFFLDCTHEDNATSTWKDFRDYLAFCLNPEVPQAHVKTNDRWGASFTHGPDESLEQRSPRYANPEGFNKALLEVAAISTPSSYWSYSKEGQQPADRPFSDMSKTWARNLPSDYPSSFGEVGKQESDDNALQAMKRHMVDPEFRGKLNSMKEAVDTVNRNNAKWCKEKNITPYFIDYGLLSGMLSRETSNWRMDAEGRGSRGVSSLGIGQFEERTFWGALRSKYIQYLAGGEEALPRTIEEYKTDLDKALLLTAAFLADKVQQTGHPVLALAVYNWGFWPKVMKGRDASVRDSSVTSLYAALPVGTVAYIKDVMQAARYANQFWAAHVKTGVGGEDAIKLADQNQVGMIKRWVYVVEYRAAPPPNYGREASTLTAEADDAKGLEPRFRNLFKYSQRMGEKHLGVQAIEVSYVPVFPELAVDAGTYSVRMYTQVLANEPPNPKSPTYAYDAYEIAQQKNNKLHWKTLEQEPGTALAYTRLPGANKWNPNNGILVPTTHPDGKTAILSSPSAPMCGVYVSYTPPRPEDLKGNTAAGPKVDNSIKDMFQDAMNKKYQGRLVSAFPSFLVMVIDGGRWIGQEHLWPHFFGRFGVQSIAVTQTREDPIDVATVTFANFYGSLTSQPAYNKMLNENDTRRVWTTDAIYAGVSQALFAFVANDDILNRRERFSKVLKISPGARLHIRMGYSANPHDLPVKFNGTISEVPQMDGATTVVALGDGAEFMKAIPLSDGYIEPSAGGGGKDWVNTGWGYTPKEPRTIIGDLFQPEKWALSLATFRAYYSDNRYGLTSFGETDFHALEVTGTGSDRFGYNHGATLVNVYDSSTAGDPTKGSIYYYWLATGMVAHLNGAHFFGVSVSDPTPWKVVEACALGVPDYICAVRPFEFRSTLFYGRQDYPFHYRYKLSTEAILGATKDKKGKQISASQKSEAVKKVQAGQGKTLFGAPTTPKTTALTPQWDDDLPRKYEEMMDKKTFAQFHIISSNVNLLSNFVSADDSEVYTGVQVKYKWGGMPILGNNRMNESNMMLADSDIFPEVQKNKIISSNIFASEFHGAQGVLQGIEGLRGLVEGVTGIRADTRLAPVAAAANSAAVNTLRQDLGKMYQGALIIAGDPYMNPWDLAYLDDQASMMNGVVQVRAVTSEMSLQTGYVTAVEPDCLVVANNSRLAGHALTAEKIAKTFVGGLVVRKTGAALAALASKRTFAGFQTILNLNGTAAEKYAFTVEMEGKTTAVDITGSGRSNLVKLKGDIPKLESQMSAHAENISSLIDKIGTATGEEAAALNKALTEAQTAAAATESKLNLAKIQLKSLSNDLGVKESWVTRAGRTVKNGLGKLGKGALNVGSGAITGMTYEDLAKAINSTLDDTEVSRSVKVGRSAVKATRGIGRGAGAVAEHVIGPQVTNSVNAVVTLFNENPVANNAGFDIGGARRGAIYTLGENEGSFRCTKVIRERGQVTKVLGKITANNGSTNLPAVGEQMEFMRSAGTGSWVQSNRDEVQTIVRPRGISKAKAFFRQAEQDFVIANRKVSSKVMAELAGKIPELLTKVEANPAARAEAAAISKLVTTYFNSPLDEELNAKLLAAIESGIGASKSAEIKGLSAVISSVRGADVAFQDAKYVRAAASVFRGGAAAASLLGNAVGLLITSCIGDMITRQLAARQAVIIMPLRIGNYEFSAGINGHMGSVYGDAPSPEDYLLASIFNPTFAAREAQKGNPNPQKMALIGQVLSFIIPIDGEAFNPSAWQELEAPTSPSGKVDVEGFDTFVQQLILTAKIKTNNFGGDPNIQPNGTATTQIWDRIPGQSGRLSFGKGLTLPIAGADLSKITAVGSFGAPITPPRTTIHRGIDFGSSNGAPAGTQILAAANGVAIHTGTGSETWAGKYVILQHAGNYQTVYAHCSEILINQGTPVAAGTPIARVGSTGNSTAPHLHFELREKGTPINPIL